MRRVASRIMAPQQRGTMTMRFLTYTDLKGLGVTYCRTQLWRLERAGKFPARVPLGENRVAWVEDEIKAWMKARVEARDARQKAA